MAVAAKVDAAIRTEQERAADIDAWGAHVVAVENAGGAGRSGLDGGDEDIDASAVSIGSTHGEEIGGQGIAGEVEIAGAVGLDVVGDFALAAAEVGGVDQEVRRIVGIDDGDKHIGIAGAVGLDVVGDFAL